MIAGVGMFYYELDSCNTVSCSSARVTMSHYELDSIYSCRWLQWGYCRTEAFTPADGFSEATAGLRHLLLPMASVRLLQDWGIYSCRWLQWGYCRTEALALFNYHHSLQLVRLFRVNCDWYSLRSLYVAYVNDYTLILTMNYMNECVQFH